MSFKINYKCGGRLREWEYVCEDCREHTTIEHMVQDDMEHRKCEHCNGLLLRYIPRAPSLDADYHQDHLTRNIGWDR